MTESALHIFANSVIHLPTKHFEVDYHLIWGNLEIDCYLVWEMLQHQQGLMKLLCVSSSYQLIDTFINLFLQDFLLSMFPSWVSWHFSIFSLWDVVMLHLKQGLITRNINNISLYNVCFAELLQSVILIQICCIPYH